MQMIICPKCQTPFELHEQHPLGVTETREAAAGLDERRTFEVSDIRTEKTEDGHYRVTGHAAVFYSKSKPLKTKTGKSFVEQIEPGAFKRSLESGRDIVMLDDHDPKKVLARTSAKTLKLAEDEHGLKFDATLPDTTVARDLVANIEHGNTRGVSFGFADPEDRWSMDGSTPVRTLTDIPLGEVSATPFPAYPATDISVRADDAIRRLAAGETDVRCYGMDGGARSETQSRMERCRSECRSLHEMAHGTHEHLRSLDRPASGDEKRHAQHLFDEAGRTRSKLAELRAHLRGLFDPQADAGPDDEPETNPPPAHDRESGRSETISRLAQELRTAIEAGLPYGHLVAALEAAAEVRSGGSGVSVHAETAARARKAIAEGRTDGGEWDAPNQGEREQEDCLGAGKSYPIFKGGKVSLAALRNAASRGAANAPAVGKEASALLALADNKN